MQFHKFLSLILHPMVIPTVGALIYLLVIPNPIQQNQRYYLLSLIFITTYFIPLLILILLKIIGYAKSFQLESIKERKIPIFLMILLFYALGNGLSAYTLLYDFTLLFYATALALMMVYVFFIANIKVSLHLISMGIMTGFFIIMGSKYSFSTTPMVLISLLLSGLLASSRLHLKAHQPKEVYIGFVLGVLSQITTYVFFIII